MCLNLIVLKKPFRSYSKMSGACTTWNRIRAHASAGPFPGIPPNCHGDILGRSHVDRATVHAVIIILHSRWGTPRGRRRTPSALGMYFLSSPNSADSSFIALSTSDRIVAIRDVVSL